MNAKTKGAIEEKKENGCHHAGTPPASRNSSKFTTMNNF